MRPLIFSLVAVLGLATSAKSQLSFVTQSVPTTRSLLGIAFEDTTVGYACGDTGTVLKTINGGTTWTKLTVPSTANFWDIKIIPGSNNQKVIVVGDNSAVYKSVNGGTTWTAQTVPISSGSFVFGIQCLDSQNYFACGGDRPTLSSSVFKTTNGGTTWTQVPSPNSVPFLDKVFMLNSTTGFTVGIGSGFSGGTINKTSNGTSFSTVKTTASVMNNLWCPNANTVIAVGGDGLIWKTTDGGTTWADKSLNGADLYGITFKDGQTGYACGGRSAGTILSTKNGGDSWTEELYSGTAVLLGAVAVRNKVFFAGEGGTIVKATARPTTGVPELNENPSGVTVCQAATPGRLTVANHWQLSGLQLHLIDGTGRLVARIRLQDALVEELPVDLPDGWYMYTVTDATNHTLGKAGKLLIR